MTIFSEPLFWIAGLGLLLLGGRFGLAICLPENHWINVLLDGGGDGADGDCGGDGGGD